MLVSSLTSRVCCGPSPRLLLAAPPRLSINSDGSRYWRGVVVGVEALLPSYESLSARAFRKKKKSTRRVDGKPKQPRKAAGNTLKKSRRFCRCVGRTAVIQPEESDLTAGLDDSLRGAIEVHRSLPTTWDINSW